VRVGSNLPSSEPRTYRTRDDAKWRVGPDRQGGNRHRGRCGGWWHRQL